MSGPDVETLDSEKEKKCLISVSSMCTLMWLSMLFIGISVFWVSLWKKIVKDKLQFRPEIEGKCRADTGGGRAVTFTCILILKCGREVKKYSLELTRKGNRHVKTENQ